MEHIVDFFVVVVLGLNLFTGSSIVFRNPKSAINRSYGFFVFFLSMFIVSVFFENRPYLFGESYTALFVRLDFTFALLLCYSWFLFCNIFSNRFRMPSWLSSVLAFAVTGLTGLILFKETVIGQIRFENEGIVFTTGPLWPTYAVLLLALATGGFLLLYFHRRKAIREGDMVSARQVAFILIGFLLSIGTSLIVFLFLQTFFKIPALATDIALYSMVFLVIFTGYAIAKYRLFQIKIIVVHGMLLVLFSLGLAYLVRQLGRPDSEIAFDLGMFFFLVITGMTLLRSVDKEVAERERAEVLVERLRDFVSFATHELRGPVTNFKGAISMIAEGDFGKVPYELKAVLRDMFIEADQMGQTVDMFLNLNKVDVGQFKLNYAENDMRSLLERIVEQLDYQIGKKGLTLTLVLPEKPVIAAFDFFKIQHVMRNVLDNAIKYSNQDGEIKVECTSNKTSVKVVMSDNGIGMQADTIQNIFTKYDPGATGLRQRIEGHGIGMWLSKKIVDLHGGTIRAESPGIGKGSIFTVVIPRKPSEKVERVLGVKQDLVSNP